MLVQQRRGRLGTNPAGAGDPIGGVAPQCDEVHHLARLDAVALTYLGGADAHHLADTTRRLQDRRRRARQLERVAIRRRDQGLAAATLLLLHGGGEKVVRLVSRRLPAHDARGREQVG